MFQSKIKNLNVDMTTALKMYREQSTSNTEDVEICILRHIYIF
jgi:hypothetical protein